MSESRKGDWMQTASDEIFWPLDPRPEEVHIEDIAHALSMQCRYAGHCRAFYSVAQHSVIVTQHCPDPSRLWGLLHDASEAYLVDIPRPVKPFLKGYKSMEYRIMTAVCQRFGLPLDQPAEVKRVDNAILADEQRCLMGPPPRPWHLPEQGLGIKITPWSPAQAKAEFLTLFKTLFICE